MTTQHTSTTTSNTQMPQPQSTSPAAPPALSPTAALGHESTPTLFTLTDVGVSYSVPVGTPRSARPWPGTLVVDVYDARTGELVWRGWAQDALAHAPEPEHMSEFIDETVGKIMQTFPPGT